MTVSSLSLQKVESNSYIEIMVLDCSCCVQGSVRRALILKNFNIHFIIVKWLPYTPDSPPYFDVDSTQIGSLYSKQIINF